jgi:hypothetical protein
LLNQLCTHWRLFRSLLFGQSLLDAADSENLIRSPFWASGLRAREEHLDLFSGWSRIIVPAQGEAFIVVSLDNLLLSVVAWLADDPELADAAGAMHALAQEITGRRVPTPEDLIRAHRLTEAFALGLDAHIGQDKPALETWAYLGGLERDHTKVRHLRELVAKRFPATVQWQAEAITSHLRPQPVYHDGIVFEFDAGGYRASLDACVSRAIRHARATAAHSISDSLAESAFRLSAGIGDKLLLSSSTRGVARTQTIAKLEEAASAALESAFPGFTPRITITAQEYL